VTENKRKDNHGINPRCEDRRRLTEQFLISAHTLTDLQNQQVEAVINHDPEFSRFDDLIHMARQEKDQAKYALIAHLESHRC
jgi:hypothetical protein